MSTPAIILNSSPYTCCGLPTPPDAILILPGLALAYAIRSGTDLAETEGCTTNTPTPRTMLATGAMSRTKSKLRLS